MAHKPFANHLSDDALPDLKIAYSKLISALQDNLVVCH